MAEIIKMPRLSDTMVEGVIVKWYKNIGDPVKEGDIIADIETDKAIQEFEIDIDGILLYKGCNEGDSVAVDNIIALIGDKDEDISNLIRKKSEESILEKVSRNNINSSNKCIKDNDYNEINNLSLNDNTDRIFISPLAKSIAIKNKININDVSGSGENGRIIKRDIEKHIQQSSINSSQLTSHYNGKNSMRDIIGKKLSISKFTAPHYYVTVDINMNSLLDLRNKINQNNSIRISINDIIVKASSKALELHPIINSTWSDGNFKDNLDINIGIAISIDGGLLVPVIKLCQNKSLACISKEIKELSLKAKERKLKVDEMNGSTFSISNLGMFGVKSFTSIINQPNCAILSVSSITKVPIFDEFNNVIVGNMMNLSLALDHRVIDGVDGANFLNTLKNLLENPLNILI